MSGQVAGRIDEVLPVRQILEETWRDCRARLRELGAWAVGVTPRSGGRDRAGRAPGRVLGRRRRARRCVDDGAAGHLVEHQHHDDDDDHHHDHDRRPPCRPRRRRSSRAIARRHRGRPGRVVAAGLPGRAREPAPGHGDARRVRRRRPHRRGRRPRRRRRTTWSRCSGSCTRRGSRSARCGRSRTQAEFEDFETPDDNSTGFSCRTAVNTDPHAVVVEPRVRPGDRHQPDREPVPQRRPRHPVARRRVHRPRQRAPGHGRRGQPARRAAFRVGRLAVGRELLRLPALLHDRRLTAGGRCRVSCRR